MKHQIWIIGTNPPCPRCALLKKVVEELSADLTINADIMHITYTDKIAIEFAKKRSLIPGTAKEVADAMNVSINIDKVNKINNSIPKENEFDRYNTVGWNPELDLYLKKYQSKAEKYNILMTPILVIDGEMKHSGSVPKLSHIEKWLREL